MPQRSLAVRLLLLTSLLPESSALAEGQQQTQRQPSPVAVPAALHASEAFSVTCGGKPSFVYLAAVQKAEGNGVVNSSFVHLTLPAGGGAVQVQVAVLRANSSAPVTSAALRPRGSPEVAQHGDATLSFSIASPGHYILELDGTYTVETLDAGLMVFVDV